MMKPGELSLDLDSNNNKFLVSCGAVLAAQLVAVLDFACAIFVFGFVDYVCHTLIVITYYGVFASC